MTRESIDIEALLVRAYRVKAVDKFGLMDERARRAWGLILLSGGGGGGGGFNVGDRVQSSSYAELQAARQSRGWAMLESCGGGELMSLHDAVLGLPTFYLERLDGLDFQVWDATTALRMGHRITVAEGAATIERVRRRGGSDPKRANELRPAGPARRLKAIEAATFLICHGRSATRPPVVDVVVTGRRPLYVGGNKRAVGYEPTYETPIADVVEQRAVYATWHACLGMLQAACDGVGDLEVTGPLAPAAPWDADPVVVPGQGRARQKRVRKDGKNDALAMA